MRPLRVHELSSCPLPEPARVQVNALGDFSPSNLNSESLALGARSAKLAFPGATLAIDATAYSNASDQVFIGYGERLTDQLDFLLWPGGTACDLLRSASYPGAVGGEAIGFAARTGLILLAGGNDDGSPAVAGAATFDTETGDALVVDPLAALSEPRAFATVTEFGDALLVAGGENPFHDPRRPASVLRDTAEVYRPETHSFEPGLLKLVEPTTGHAAVTLETGETVLIGGRISASDASTLVQIISPETRVTKLLKQLSVGRDSPTALRLDNGQLLVAGGTDASGSPVAQLEWRSADGSAISRVEAEVTLHARFDRAYIPLAGGAALAVGGCSARSPATGEDCQASCQRGCPPDPDADTGQRYDAYWISPEGQLSRLDFPIDASRPVLLPGSDGQPWLIADGPVPGERAAQARALYRFDPWQKIFTRAAVEVDLGQLSSSARFFATGSDSFAWLSADGSAQLLRGMRLGTRSRFSNDGRLVELRDPDDSRRPAHLVPDHPPGVDVEYDSQRGALTFAAGATSCVWISDARYADFVASVAFTGPFAPSLRLGAERLSVSAPSATETACQLPAFTAGNAASATLQLERRGAQLSSTIGSSHASCQLPEGRLPFGVCGNEQGAVRVSLITVTRGG